MAFARNMLLLPSDAMLSNPTSIDKSSNTHRMNYLQQTDETLIHLVVQKNQEAFSTLYDRHAGQMLGVIYKVLGERGASEEVLQEAFWRVWEKADTFDPSKAKFTTWLFSIARRMAIDVYRRQQVRPQPAQSEQAVLKMESAVSQLPSVIDQVDISFEGDKVREALNGLSPEQRTVIEMAYFQGKTRREIASELEVPVGTIHTRARLALQYLRQSLILIIVFFLSQGGM